MTHWNRFLGPSDHAAAAVDDRMEHRENWEPWDISVRKMLTNITCKYCESMLWFQGPQVKTNTNILWHRITKLWRHLKSIIREFQFLRCIIVTTCCCVVISNNASACWKVFRQRPNSDSSSSPPFYRTRTPFVNYRMNTAVSWTLQENNFKLSLTKPCQL